MSTRKPRRWMKWIFEEADNFDVVLPFERGARRKLWRRHLSAESLRLLSSKA